MNMIFYCVSQTLALQYPESHMKNRERWCCSRSLLITLHFASCSNWMQMQWNTVVTIFVYVKKSCKWWVRQMFGLNECFTQDALQNWWSHVCSQWVSTEGRCGSLATLSSVPRVLLSWLPVPSVLITWLCMLSSWVY